MGGAAGGGATQQSSNSSNSSSHFNSNASNSSNTTTSDRVEKGAELRERPERERDHRDRDRDRDSGKDRDRGDRGERDGRGAGERRWNEPSSGSGGGSAGYGGQSREQVVSGGWKRSSDKTDREFGRDRDRREFGAARGGDRDRDRDSRAERERVGGDTEAAERFAAAFGRKADSGSDRRLDRERSDGAGRGFDRSVRRDEREFKERDRERERDDREHKDRGGDWGLRVHSDNSSRFPRNVDRRLQDDSERRGDADRDSDEYRDGFGGFSRQSAQSATTYSSDGSVPLDDSEIARLQARYGPAASGPLAYSRTTILDLFQPSSPPPSLQAVSAELGLVSAACLAPVALSVAAPDADGSFWLSSKGSWKQRQQSGALGRRQYSGGSATHALQQAVSGSDRSTPAWFDQPVASILDDEQAVVMTNDRVERERTDRRMERERERNANSTASEGRQGPERQRSEAESSGWTEAAELGQSRKPTSLSAPNRAATVDNATAHFDSSAVTQPPLPISPPSLPVTSNSSPVVGSSVSQWYYKDPQDETQGPFSASEMRDWYTKGYFDLKLRVTCTHTADSQQQQRVDDGQFVPLGMWFIAGKKAFLEHVPTLTHDQPSSTPIAPTPPIAPARLPPPQLAPQAVRLTPQRSFHAAVLDDSTTDPRVLESSQLGGGLYSSMAVLHDEEEIDGMVRLVDASLRFVDDDTDRQPNLSQHSQHMLAQYNRQQQLIAQQASLQQHSPSQLQAHPTAAIDGSWSTPPVAPYVSARMSSPVGAPVAGLRWPTTSFSPHHSLAISSPRSVATTAQLHTSPSPVPSTSSSAGSSMLQDQVRQAQAAMPLAGGTHPATQPQQLSPFVPALSTHVAAQRSDGSYSFQTQQPHQHGPDSTLMDQQQQQIAAQRQLQAVALARERLLHQQQQRQQQQRMVDGASVWISSPQQLREREEMMRRQQQQQQQFAERDEAERRLFDEQQRAAEELHLQRQRETEVEGSANVDGRGERQQGQRFQSAVAHSSTSALRGSSVVSNTATSSQSAPHWPATAAAPSTLPAGRTLTLSEVQALDADETEARDRETRRRHREHEEEQRRAVMASAGSVWKSGGQQTSAAHRSLADIMAEEAQQSHTHFSQQQQQQQQQQRHQQQSMQPEQHARSGKGSTDSSAWQQGIQAVQQDSAALWGVSLLPASLASTTNSPPSAAVTTAPQQQRPSGAPSSASLTREQRLAAEQHSKATVNAERSRRDETAQRAKAEEDSRRKAEAVERGKVQAAKVWGTLAHTIDLRAIQQQEAEASRLAEERREQRLREQQLAAAQSTVLGSVWGGVNPLTQNIPPTIAPSAAKAATRPVSESGSGSANSAAALPSHATPPPSLKDIQAMEVAHVNAAASPVRTAGGIVPPSTGGVWNNANNATNAANSHATSAAGRKNSGQPATTIRLIDEPYDIWGYTATANANNNVPAINGQAKHSRPGSSAKAPSSSHSPAASSSSSAAFGVDCAMSADFSAWCRTQLNQLTGSSDLTLAHYLLSLDSAQQVEETCITYLGATEPVRRFAHEFIANAQFDKLGVAPSTASQHSGASSTHDSSSRRDTDDNDKRRRGGKKRGQ